MASANTSELGGFSAWVWSHFTLVQISDDVVKTECRNCRRMLAYMGQTTSMLKHLRTVHCMIPPPSPSIPRRVAQATASQLSTAFDAAVVHYDLNTIIAGLAAEEHVPSKTIATSPTFKLLLESLVGRASPKSPNSVKAIVNTRANEARKSVRDSLEQYQRSGKSFSICFDEAVASNSQHSYISLSLRTEPAAGDDHAGPDTYLGLIQLAGKGNADTIAAAVTNRLREYGVNIRNCFFAVTDGAAVMESTVSKLGLKSQLCFAHALHIALQKARPIGECVHLAAR